MPWADNRFSVSEKGVVIYTLLYDVFVKKRECGRKDSVKFEWMKWLRLL